MPYEVFLHRNFDYQLSPDHSSIIDWVPTRRLIHAVLSSPGSPLLDSTTQSAWLLSAKQAAAAAAAERAQSAASGSSDRDGNGLTGPVSCSTTTETEWPGPSAAHLMNGAATATAVNTATVSSTEAGGGAAGANGMGYATIGLAMNTAGASGSSTAAAGSTSTVPPGNGVYDGVLHAVGPSLGASPTTTNVRGGGGGGAEYGPLRPHGRARATDFSETYEAVAGAPELNASEAGLTASIAAAPPPVGGRGVSSGYGEARYAPPGSLQASGTGQSESVLAGSEQPGGPSFPLHAPRLRALSSLPSPRAYSRHATPRTWSLERMWGSYGSVPLYANGSFSLTGALFASFGWSSQYQYELRQGGVSAALEDRAEQEALGLLPVSGKGKKSAAAANRVEVGVVRLTRSLRVMNVLQLAWSYDRWLWSGVFNLRLLPPTQSTRVPLCEYAMWTPRTEWSIQSDELVLRWAYFLTLYRSAPPAASGGGAAVDTEDAVAVAAQRARELVSARRAEREARKAAAGEGTKRADGSAVAESSVKAATPTLSSSPSASTPVESKAGGKETKPQQLPPSRTSPPSSASAARNDGGGDGRSRGGGGGGVGATTSSGGSPGAGEKVKEGSMRSTSDSRKESSSSSSSHHQQPAVSVTGKGGDRHAAPSALTGVGNEESAEAMAKPGAPASRNAASSRDAHSGSGRGADDCPSAAAAALVVPRRTPWWKLRELKVGAGIAVKNDLASGINLYWGASARLGEGFSISGHIDILQRVCCAVSSSLGPLDLSVRLRMNSITFHHTTLDAGVCYRPVVSCPNVALRASSSATGTCVGLHIADAGHALFAPWIASHSAARHQQELARVSHLRAPPSASDVNPDTAHSEDSAQHSWLSFCWVQSAWRYVSGGGEEHNAANAAAATSSAKPSVNTKGGKNEKPSATLNVAPLPQKQQGAHPPSPTVPPPTPSVSASQRGSFPPLPNALPEWWTGEVARGAAAVTTAARVVGSSVQQTWQAVRSLDWLEAALDSTHVDVSLGVTKDPTGPGMRGFAAVSVH